MPRTEDEPVLEEPERDESEEEGQDELPGSVGPSSPLDSGLFWLS